ncbi:MAG: MFS transporter [Firmicutes bacterium]|nr:MFS transporter [Bacillota bacterium]
MTANPQPQSGWPQRLSGIFRDREYRALFVTLLLAGLASGTVIPYFALWVVHVLHGTTREAAWIFVPQGVMGVISGIGQGALSDRVGRRKPILLVSMAVTTAAWLGLSLVVHYGSALVLSGLSGLGGIGLLFSLVGDVIRHKHASGQHGLESTGFITTMERAAFSLGFLLGPVLGGLVVLGGGYAAVFRAAALVEVVALGFGAWALPDPQRLASARRAAQGSLALRDVALLTVLAGAGMALMAGDTGRSMFLPLYLTQTLHLPVVAVSGAFSLTVVGELFFMPLSGLLADRIGAARVLMAGALAQALFFFLLSHSVRYWEVLLLQVFYALVISATSGVAIVFSQQMFRGRRLGLATTTYQSMRGLAPVVNSVLAWATASVVPHIFDALSALAIFGVILLDVIRRARGSDPAVESG